MFKNRNIIIFCLVYSSAFCMGFVPIINGPNRYFPQIKGWLTLHKEPVDWLTARIKCHMEGAFLASPWSPEFTETVLYTAAIDQSDEQAIQVLYSGVHISFPEGALIKTKGLSVLSLKPGDLEAIERCGVFFANGTTGEVDCRQRLPYVCYSPTYEAQDDSTMFMEPEVTTEIEPDSVSATEWTTDELSSPIIGEWAATDSSITKWGTTDSEPELASSLTLKSNCGDESLGYEYSEKTGRCYKFHANAVHTWEDAQFACKAEGAQLAIVNSDEEAQVLSKLFAQYPPEDIRGATFLDTAAIGFLKRSIWETIDGDSLEKAGYENWRPNAPHPSASYGFICRDGLLFGYVSNIRDVPYICEKEPSKPETKQGLQTSKQHFYESTIKNNEQSSSEDLDKVIHNILKETLIQEKELNAKSKQLEHGFWEDMTSEATKEATDEAINQANKQTTEQKSEQKLELPQFDCGHESLGYEFEEITGQCYKIHAQVAKSWHAMKTACEEEGAYLALLNSADNAQVFIKLFAKYRAEGKQGLLYPDTTTIDYSKPSSFDPWDDESLERAVNDMTTPDVYIKFICEKKPIERKPEPERNVDTEVNREANKEFEQTSSQFYHEFETESANTVGNNEQSTSKYQIVYDWQRTLDENENPTVKKNEEGQITQLLSGNQFQQELESAFEEGANQATEKATDQIIDTSTEQAIDQRTEDATEESEQKLELPLFGCGDKSLGYKFEEVTGQCYKFHAQVANSWYAAKTACEEEGADLAVVNSVDEAQVLSKLFAEYPPEEINGTAYPDTAAIGYYKASTDDPWKTIHGETLQEAGYDMWRPDAPHPLARVGFISRDGKLFGYVAYVRDVPFICEKKPVERKPLDHEVNVDSETTTAWSYYEHSPDYNFDLSYQDNFDGYDEK